MSETKSECNQEKSLINDCSLFKESLYNNLEKPETGSSDEEKPETGSSDEESDSSNECNYSFEYTKNSSLFVVSINDIPTFYVKDKKTAFEKMWSVARSLATEEFFSGYHTHYYQLSPTELHIIGSYRFFLIAYDKTIHRITYSKIKECIY